MEVVAALIHLLLVLQVEEFPDLLHHMEVRKALTVVSRNMEVHRNLSMDNRKVIHLILSMALLLDSSKDLLRDSKEAHHHNRDSILLISNRIRCVRVFMSLFYGFFTSLRNTRFFVISGLCTTASSRLCRIRL